MEALLRQKDTEIQSLQTQLGERESAFWALSKKLQGAEFENQVQRLSLLELEKDHQNSDKVLRSRLESLEYNRELQIRQVADRQEAHTTQLMTSGMEKDRQISALQQKLETWQYTEHIVNELRDALEQSDDEKNKLRQRIIDLEVTLATTDKVKNIRLLCTCHDGTDIDV